MDKKGVNPTISVILLVVLAFGSFGIVRNFVRDFENDQIEKISNFEKIMEEENFNFEEYNTDDNYNEKVLKIIKIIENKDEEELENIIKLIEMYEN